MEVVSTLQVNVEGTRPENRLQFVLVDGIPARIGRAPQSGWSIPWDLAISREHADLCWHEGRLTVTCLSSARNNLVFQNEQCRRAVLRVGEKFRIGKTVFEAAKQNQQLRSGTDTEKMHATSGDGVASEEHSFSAADLRNIAFRNSSHQLELLSRLPSLISATKTDEELQQTICRLLLDAIPHANAVAVTHYDISQLQDTGSILDEFPDPLLMRVETRADGADTFRPSRRIVLQTLLQQSSQLYIWHPDESSLQFTMLGGMNWAFCAPIQNSSSQGWCLYVSGHGGAVGGVSANESELSADLRFTELVAQFIGSVHQVRALQEKQTQLKSFFSPKVIASLTSTDNENVMTPAERDITVLFCDVRGFSRRAEALQDNLLALLENVRAALGVMVEAIMDFEGAIADFQGDAALGFWGWPVPHEDGPIPACLAAIQIASTFREGAAIEDSRLGGFSVGIGVAHGRAIAGQIGTRQQSKIGVFGPVVNQGARLEGLTRKFGVPICIDGRTARYVAEQLPDEAGRLRHLADVRPGGMSETVEVFGFLQSDPADEAALNVLIDTHHRALDCVKAGRWDSAVELLRKLPASDGPRQFLLKKMNEYNNAPPADWDGVFSLHTK